MFHPMPMPKVKTVLTNRFKEQSYKTATLRFPVIDGNFTFEKGDIVSVRFKRISHNPAILGSFDAIYSISHTTLHIDGYHPEVPETMLERFVL